MRNIRDSYVYKLFKTNQKYYILDSSRNKIHNLSEDEYIALNNCILKEDQLGKLEERGIIHRVNPQRIRVPYLNNVGYYYSHRLGSITLQVTQACNFRCSYCVYSEATNEHQRSHTNTMMSFNVARAAIDFLIENSCDEERISISFYGGEPLLNFKLIKECYNYIQKKYPYKNITYTMTTNGSLLNEEIISFLVEINCILTISIDGPQKINDKNRRLAKDGSATFNLVEKNLLCIRDKYPDYYKTILISAVSDYSSDLNEINKYFYDKLGINNSNIIMNGIDFDFSSKKEYVPYNFYVSNQFELFKALMSRLLNEDSIYFSPICNASLKSIERIAQTINDNVKIIDEVFVSGPCTPGIGRLFVTVDGNLFPCERVSETSLVLKLGDVFSGFDLEKIRYLMNVVNLTAEDCMHCWAAYYCKQCLKHADNKTELSKEKRRSYCQSVLSAIESDFMLYLLFRECSAVIHK